MSAAPSAHQISKHFQYVSSMMIFNCCCRVNQDNVQDNVVHKFERQGTSGVVQTPRSDQRAPQRCCKASYTALA